MKAKALLLSAGLVLVLGSAACTGQATVRIDHFAGCAGGDCCAPASVRCMAACGAEGVLSRRDCRESCAVAAATCSAARPDSAARVAVYQELGRIARSACSCTDAACRERALGELGAWGKTAYGIPATVGQQAFVTQTLERTLACTSAVSQLSAMAQPAAR